MAKKSFFEKIGLVESNESEQSLEEMQEELKSFSTNINENETQKIEIPEDMTLEGVIEVNEIYEKFSLSDMSNSIYRIDEFLSVLPKELNNESKKSTVIGILGTSNLQLENLLEDGEQRKNVLVNTLTAFTEETESIVSAKKVEIEELEAKIDVLKTEINNRKKAQEQQEDIITSEKEKIDAIINFVK